MTGDAVVLVISPSPYMTNKIQQALEIIGGYRVITCKSPVNAFEFAHKDYFSTCILDIFHPDFPLSVITNELTNIQPEMNFILIVSDQGISQQAVPEKMPFTHLPRTFTTDQLSLALSHSIQEQPSTGTLNSLTDQPLLKPDTDGSTPRIQIPETQPLSQTGDFSNLDQRLAELPLDTPPLEMILIRRKQLLIHRGNLPSSAIQELVDLVNSFRNTSPQNLHKEFQPGQLKSSSGDMIRLTQLNSIPGKNLLYVVSFSKDINLVQLYDQATPFSKIRRQTILIMRKLLEMQPAVSLEYRPSQPEPEQPAQPLANEEELKSNLTGESASITSDSQDEERSTTELELANNVAYNDISETDNPWIGEALQALPTDTDRIPDHPVTSDNFNSTLTQAPFGHYITYSCLLVPRMPQHLLTSNLASFLFTWMGQLCLAYGWRLEHLSIHANHIQMVTGAPLTTSPAFLVRTLRQKTSQYIFNQFPPLSNENPSGDFWAPGFFIAGGKHPIQPHQIDQYVSEIREHQGVYPVTPN